MKKKIIAMAILAGIILTPQPQEQPQEQHKISYAQEQELIDAMEKERAKEEFEKLPEQVQHSIARQDNGYTEDTATATETETITANYTITTCVKCDKCGELIEVQDGETAIDAIYNHDIEQHDYNEIR